MFVVSVEGGAYINKSTWTTHKILGVGPSRAEALAWVALEDFDEQDILIVTNFDNGEVERIDTTPEAAEKQD
jgi:hypothetical protein